MGYGKIMGFLKVTNQQNTDHLLFIRLTSNQAVTDQ